MKTYLACFLFTAMCLFALTTFSFGQTYEEYEKFEKEQLAKFKIEQEKEIEKLAQEYNAYVKQADKEFSDYLKKEWEEYKAFQGVPIPERPKPVEIPVAETNQGIPLPSQRVSVLAPGTDQRIATNKLILPIIQKTEAPVFLTASTQIDFFGSHHNFSYDQDLNKNTPEKIDEQSIARWWTANSKTNYNTLINELLTSKNNLSLNDWTYFLLVNKVAAAMADKNINKARLLAWFFMIRSGYNVKVAFNDDKIFLLFPSVNELYGKSFLKINNQHFYFVEDVSPDEFQTYDFDFPGATRVIDFNIHQPLNIGDDVVEKKIKFTYKEKEIMFPVLLNVNTLYLLRDYPVTDLSVFFNAAMSGVTKQSLAEGITPLIHNMSENEALNFLLGFVQKAFVYKTDQEQFNKEKFFFPEELFFYPGSDCEDRSVLFTYLVKQLLHLEIIGLEYDGHVATAVVTNISSTGDYLMYNNNKYVIADPTYINAPLGLTMPRYKNKVAKVIETNNTDYLTSVSNNYWELTNKSGGFRGSNLCDSKCDNHGNWYLTGYYTQNVSFSDEDWNPDGSRQPFIVKYNKEKEVVWARNIETNGIASGFAITLDALGNPVVAGSFRGEIAANGIKLSTKNNKDDIFIAGYGANGDLKWLEKSGLDTINYSQFLNYVIRFSDKGQHLSTKLYLENASNASNGIFNIDNSFTLVGGINFTISYNAHHLAFNAEKNFNIITYLKEESDALVQSKVDKSIAGLCAVINLIKSSGMIIPGKDAQLALDKYNPGFKSSSPSIYENIGNVVLMKNEEGVISVQTSNNKSVAFDKIKISNGAKLKITSLQDGNEQVDVMSGIEVGKAFVWYDLNFIRIIPSTGNILFDYDSDHTQKTVNMKEDILD
jgi:hypothetical protein